MTDQFGMEKPMAQSKENVVLDVKAQNAYLYKQDDVQSLLVSSASVKDNSQVTLRTKGSSTVENYRGSFQNWILNRLAFNDSGCINTKSSNAAEITVERTPAVITVSAGAFEYIAPLEDDRLGLYRVAAPYKATFKPLATRYELEAKSTQDLFNTATKLCSPDKVYRISTIDGNPATYNYITPEVFGDLVGITPLRDGRAVSKHKSIKMFKLENGCGIKLGNNIMIALTEAEPKYKDKQVLFVKQQDPDTNRWYLEPVKVKVSKGFNTDLKQFAYDVTMDNGNQLFDIPESDLFVEKIPQQEQPKEWSHF